MHSSVVCHSRSGGTEEHQLWLSRNVLLPLHLPNPKCLPALNPALNPALSVSVGFLAALSSPRARQWTKKAQNSRGFLSIAKAGSHTLLLHTVQSIKSLRGTVSGQQKASALYACFECGLVPFAAQDWQQLCCPFLQLGN